MFAHFCIFSVLSFHSQYVDHFHMSNLMKKSVSARKVNISEQTGHHIDEYSSCIPTYVCQVVTHQFYYFMR